MSRPVWWTCIAGAFLFVASASWAGGVPPRSAGGQTLDVPPAQLELGDVYYVIPGEDTQIVCVSDAPLQRVALTCNRVVGYVVSPFELEEGKAPLVAGALRIPVAALDPGLRDVADILTGKALLNVAEFPEFTFGITRISDVKPEAEEGKRKSFALTIHGELTLKDKSVALELPARVSLIPFTWQTMGRAVGELLTIKTHFDLKLADLGLQPPDRSFKERMAESVSVDVFLLCNTMTPEKTLDPRVKAANHVKQLQFLTLVRDFDDAEKGYDFGRAYMHDVWGDGGALQRLASAMVTEPSIRRRDLGFALKAALRANELTESKDPSTLATLARVYYEKGELDTALKWARLAVENLGQTPAPEAAEIRAALEQYEQQAAKERG